MSSNEIQDVKSHIIKSIQQKTFEDEYDALKSKKPLPNKSMLIFLKPVLNEYLPFDTRHAEYLPFDTRHPIILPRKDWVTKTIVKWYHEKANHVTGTSHTLSLTGYFKDRKQ